MKRIKLYLSILFVGSLVANCNSDADDLGVQFFNKNAGEGVVEAYDLAVYNVDNGDRVKYGTYDLQKAVLGVFSEEQFGTQKVSYVTQIRLSSYAPKFGVNPIVDSVVLEFQPEYHIAGSTTSLTDKIYNGEESVQSLTSYKSVKYGDENKSFTIEIKEIIEDLGKKGDEIYSDRNVAEGNVIGSKIFDGNVTAVNIKKKTDNSVLLSKDAGIRIFLDRNFFQNKIADKAGSQELATEEAFINYFKGLKFYVKESDGYLISFAPNNVLLKMYYTSGDVGARTSSSYNFNLGHSNVRFSQITYNRSNSFTAVKSSVDKINGDAKLYTQGMGGPGVGVKLSGDAVDSLIALYKKDKSAILSAKIRLYVDDSLWKNSYTLPTSFLVKQQGSTDFITDIKTMLTNANYRMVAAYTSTPSYYDIDITKTIKDIVEQGAEAKDLVINVGEYLTRNGVLVEESYNNNAYSPYRVVLVGTDIANKNKAKLFVTRIVK